MFSHCVLKDFIPMDVFILWNQRRMSLNQGGQIRECKQTGLELSRICLSLTSRGYNENSSPISLYPPKSFCGNAKIHIRSVGGFNIDYKPYHYIARPNHYGFEEVLYILNTTGRHFSKQLSASWTSGSYDLLDESGACR